MALESIDINKTIGFGDLVTDRVRDAILSGDLAPGSILYQEQLARDLGVSRQPVRDALRRLESEGLLTPGVGRSVVVRSYTNAEVLENYRLRALLESEGASDAALNSTDEERSQLVVLNDQMVAAVQANDLRGAVSLNNAFHTALRRASKMITLDRLLATLWIGHMVWTPLTLPGRAERSVAEHKAVLSAVLDRDPAAAKAAMSEHILRAASELAEHFEEQPQSASSDGRGEG